MIYNTAYKIKVDNATDEKRLLYNIEEGAFVTTASGVWTVYNNEWRKIYPQAGESTGLGWARYEDTEYTSSNKFNLTSGVEYTIPNNSGVTVKSYPSINFYNPTTKKILSTTQNDVYVMTVIFKCSVSNAEQGHLDLHLEGGNGTPYDRIRAERNFTKGNDVDHDFHQVFQFYSDSSVITYGLDWKVTSTGSDGKIWDIIYFIQKTQSYA